MNTLRPPLSQLVRAAGQRGAGIIEMMVGVLIGMIVVAVVYNVLVLAEGYKRSTIGVADAQVTGQLTQYILGREIANGGAAMMMGVDELAGCSDWRLKALPVAITAGANANTSDEFTVYYSSSPRVVHPVRFSSSVPPANSYVVDSPNGFKSNDWIIATNRQLNCALTRVSGVTQPDGATPVPPAGVGGAVALAYSPVTAATAAVPTNTDSRAINMGPQLMRVHYTVDATKAQLNTQNVNWLDPGFPLPVVPLSQNVVLLKAQYGVDTNNDNLLDCWTSAITGSACGGVDYRGPVDPKIDGGAGNAPFPVAATAAQLRAIKAVRVAIVVRSEHQERQDALAASLVGQTAWLFNCAANDGTCQGRIQIDNTVLNDYSRYRIYETVIPLRNAIWSQP